MQKNMALEKAWRSLAGGDIDVHLKAVTITDACNLQCTHVDTWFPIQ